MKIRLWLARLICPKGYGIIKALPITAYTARADDNVFALGMATSDVKCGDVVSVVNSAYIAGGEEDQA
ncbi:MAG: hypothetical protein GY944_04570 [bacterium]|nr:hypothetical protein [bacterium]